VCCRELLLGDARSRHRHTAVPRNLIWAGVLAWPLIGATVGELYLVELGRSRFARAAMAPLTPYVAAALFGLAIGVFDTF